MNKWNRELEVFLEDCERAIEISEANLHKLMEDNKDTEYGKQWGFAAIKNMEDYQRRVPVSVYSDYEEYVEQMCLGKENLLTSYDIKHFILSSGSTGIQKRIPLTREALTRCVDSIFYVSYAKAPDIDLARILHLSVFRMNLPQEQRDTILSAAYFRELHDRGTYDLERRYLGGEKLLFSTEIGLVPYVKLWIAFSSPDMSAIQAFFLYDILLFLRYTEENWKLILEHIKKRSIPTELPLSESVKQALLDLPVPSKLWFDRIEEECERGFEGIVKRLWREVRWVSGVGGGTFLAQEKALRKYLGDIPIHYFTYAASECMMGITTELEKPQNILIPQSGIFEFIPYREESLESREERPRRIDELETGREYEILVTNFSGFYRYRLEDIVKVTGFCGESPVVEVCFRKNQAINIAGEKMDLQIIAKAVEKLGRHRGFEIYEYSIFDDKTLLPGRYQCFLEVKNTGKNSGPTEKQNMGAELDEILMELNDDYRDLRQLGMIGQAAVYIVASGTHMECKRLFQKKQAQMKPMQYLSNPVIIEYMKERII